MKGLTLTMVTAAALLIGCNSNTETETETKADTATAGSASISKSSEAKSTSGTSTGTSSASASSSSTAAAAPAYEEVKRDGHIYVVASKASADKVRGGQKLKPTVTAFGFGPNGERVYFETDKEGKLDQVLMAEFTRRHPK